MVDETIELLLSAEEQERDIDDGKKQKILECIACGNSKVYLGKNYTEKRINKLSQEDINKLFVVYENNLSAQMAKSLGKSIINIYSTVACSLLKIENPKELSDDLESDPFLNKALQRFTCSLYYRFGSLLAPVSVGIITSRHCVKNILANNKNGGTTNNEQITQQITQVTKNPKKVEAGKRLAEYNRKKREEFRKYELGKGDGGNYVVVEIM